MWRRFWPPWKSSVQGNLVNKSFSYHPFRVWQFWITGMYFYIALPRPQSDTIFGLKCLKSEFGLGGLLNFLVDLFSGLRILWPNRPSPWGVEGGCGATCDTSCFLCFGNIFHKCRKSEKLLCGIARGSINCTALRTIGRTSGNRKSLLWVGSSWISSCLRV